MRTTICGLIAFDLDLRGCLLVCLVDFVGFLLALLVCWCCYVCRLVCCWLGLVYMLLISVWIFILWVLLIGSSVACLLLCIAGLLPCGGFVVIMRFWRVV